MLSHRRALQSLGTLLIVLGLLAGYVSPALSSTWTVAKIADFASSANFFPDVVASPNGNFYAAYKYSSPNPVIEELKVLKWNGSSWTTLHTITPAAPGINLTTFGDYVWLVVQSESNIHLAFGGFKGSGVTSERGVHYGHYNGTAWTFDTVDVYSDPNGWKNVSYFNMTVDASNRPHIAIAASDANGSRTSTLIHAVKNGSWTKSTVRSYTGGSELINYPSITTDPSGKAYIGYEDASSIPNKLIVSTNATGAWTHSEIASETGGAGLSLYDLRSDSYGKLHATYIEFGATRNCFYATNESGSWTAIRVPGSTGDEDVPRLSFNGNGTKLLTYVSYKTDGMMTNMVAVQNPGGSWVTEPASSATDIGWFIGSAINNSNQVMLVDQRDQTLWYATATISLTEVTSVAVPWEGWYTAGQTLDFTVTFNEAVTVSTGGGTPYLPVTLNSGAVQAAYVSGSGTKSLLFRYTVANGSFDPDGIALGSGIVLNGGTIKNSLLSDAKLALKGVPVTAGIKVDAVAPAAPTIDYPTNGSIFNDNTPTYRGHAEPSSSVKIMVDGSLIGTVTAGGTGFWVFTPTAALSDGSHSVYTTATDTVGNTGAASAINTFTIDTTPPDVPALVQPANGSISSNNSPTFSGTAQPSTWVNIYLDSVHRGSALAADDGSWSFRILGEYIADGTHTVWATATDSVGNESGPSNTHTFTIDTTPPPPPVITSPANGATINDNTPTITGTAEAGSTVRIYLENGTLLGAPVADASGNWSLTPIDTILDGLHSIGGRATDPYGNESNPAAIVLFTVDTVAPAAPVVETPMEGSIISDSTPTVTGTAEAKSTVEIIVDGSAIGTAQVSSTGDWSLIPTTPLSDGPHTVRATATDSAGNTSPASVTKTFTLDTAAPTVTLTSTAQNPTKNAVISVQVTFSEPVMGLVDKAFTVVNGTVTSLTGSEAIYTLEVTASGQGLVSVHLPAGYASDFAGNSNQASNTLTRTFDSVAPTLTSITRGDPSPTNANTVHYTVTFSEPLAALGAADFDLTTTGLTGAAVESVDWDNGVFVVTVSTGTGSGTLRVDLISGALADLAGNALVSTGDGWQNGVYTGGEVYSVDRTPPVAELLSAEKLPLSGSSAYSFTVRYSDEQGIDPAQFADGNIRLTGTDFDQPARYVSSTEVTAGKVYEVTYAVDAPASGWESIPYQTYSLVLQADQVKDSNGTYTSETVLGSIQKQMHIVVLPLINW